MKTLVIDTSTTRSVVGIVENGQILSQSELPAGYSQSKNILVHIQSVFRDAGVEGSDISFVTTTIGPGSYTGMRVGVAAAKCLAFAWKIPLVGICSLMGFVPISDGNFACIIDARMGGAYIVKGCKKGSVITYILPPEVCSIAKLAGVLEDVDVVLTPQKERMEEYVGKVELMEMAPSVLHIAQQAERKFFDGKMSTDGALTLMYMRKTQAEIDREVACEVACEKQT